MSTERTRIQAVLDLASKHRERADDRETAAGVADQRAHVAALDAARHRARLDGLLYAIKLIREISDAWTASADESSKYGRKNDGDVIQRREHAQTLDELAFRLLSEVDES